MADAGFETVSHFIHGFALFFFGALFSFHLLIFQAFHFHCVVFEDLHGFRHATEFIGILNVGNPGFRITAGKAGHVLRQFLDTGDDGRRGDEENDAKGNQDDRRRDDDGPGNFRLRLVGKGRILLDQGVADPPQLVGLAHGRLQV